VTGSVGLVEGRTILAAAVYGAASTITSPLTTSTRTCVPAEQALADSRSALNSLLIIQSRIIHHGSFYHGQTPHPCDRNECGSFALWAVVSSAALCDRRHIYPGSSRSRFCISHPPSPSARWQRIVQCQSSVGQKRGGAQVHVGPCVFAGPRPPASALSCRHSRSSWPAALPSRLRPPPLPRRRSSLSQYTAASHRPDRSSMSPEASAVRPLHLASLGRVEL
jgi:hypothetical protein